MTKIIEPTKCNTCISAGGGDCATCEPETAPQKEQPNNLDEFIITRAELFCLLPKNPPIALLDEMVSSIISEGAVKQHDSTTRNATQKLIIDTIKKTDSGACPHNQCRRGDGHDNLNCRDCLIVWIEESLRKHGE